MNDVRPLCTQLDISATVVNPVGSPPQSAADASETNRLLRDMITMQQKSCELLAELVNQVSLQQRQRAAELKAWKEANPRLATDCRQAAEALTKVHTEFLSSIAQEACGDLQVLWHWNEFIQQFATLEGGLSTGDHCWVFVNQL